MIQPLGKSPQKRQKGLDRNDKQRQSQTSLSSQGSTLSKSSDGSSLWDVTSYKTSQSTLKADYDDTSEGNTSSRSTPDGCNTPRTLTDGHQSPIDDDDIYENVHDSRAETPPIYDNIEEENIISAAEKVKKPILPPRTRPLPPLPTDSSPFSPPTISKLAKPVPALPARNHSPVSQTPPNTKRSSQEITIKISPHQSITIKTAANGQAEAVHVNSLLPEDRTDGSLSHDRATDSDDSFFDDDSFETVSDLLENEVRKSKPFPPPKPAHLKKYKKATQEQVDRLMNDPKLKDWLQEQSSILRENSQANGPGGPVAHSTPPASRRELENRLRVAFGKPTLSEEELDKSDEDDAAPRATLPTPTKQHAALPGLTNQQVFKQKGETVEYTDMNDLNAPDAPATRKSRTEQWGKSHVGEDGDTSSASLTWDYAQDIGPKKPVQVKKIYPDESPETVYMDMRSPVEGKKKQHPLPPRPGSPSAFRRVQEKISTELKPPTTMQTPSIEKPVPPPPGRTQTAGTPQSSVWDDEDSFDSFESDTDDEGVPNSCHQVAVHFRPDTKRATDVSNLVIATPNGDIIPHTRHSSTNAMCISLPGAKEIARKNSGKAPSSPTKIRKPSFSNPNKPKNEIIVVHNAAEVNGLPLNQTSPPVLRRTASIQEDRNVQLVTSIKQSPGVDVITTPSRENQIAKNNEALPKSPSRTSLGNISNRSFSGDAESVSLSGSTNGTPNSQRQRRVTIGSEEIKIISDQEKLPKDHDHRQITYDSKGKMRITIIGGNSDGIFVHRIDPGSDAEQQGLMEGDQILKINGISTGGQTKEDVLLQLMSLQKVVSLTVRHKKDRYDGIINNGGMGDSFFVKAFFNHMTTHKGELKIQEGDIFSVRDTLPSGRIGSWQALKVNAKPNETQHGLIPNQSRAEQVALAAKKDRGGRGIEKENRGSFIRRSLRRSKSAERLTKENEAFTKSQAPQLEDVRTYERVEQKAPGFLRPVVILGLFCDTVRDRILQEIPGLYEKPPPEVEIPTTAEAGDAFKVPVDIRVLQHIINNNKHPLMIMSPRSIQYLQANTKLYPIVIYLTPGSKNVVKSLRQTFAPGFNKRSSYMYEESQAFNRTYSHLFTATVTYTADDLWYTLLKDTIQRIQNQPLWQPVPPNSIGDNDSLLDTSPAQSPKSPSNKLPKLASSARKIPDPIRDILQRHAQESSGSGSARNSSGMEEAKPVTTLTYDGYFLSDNQQPSNRSPSGPTPNRDDFSPARTPRSILKNKEVGNAMVNGNFSFDQSSPPKQYQQIGLVVPIPNGNNNEENNNAIQHHVPPVSKQQQLQMEMMMQQQENIRQQQQMRMLQEQKASQQSMLIQQMFQQQFIQPDPRLRSSYDQQPGMVVSPTRSRGRNHESVETDL